MNFIKWFSTPQTTKTISSKNFVNVQIDAIGVGLASGAATFLPVYLTRLNATSIDVGMLTAMPAVTGFLLAIVLGRILQKQKKIVPWFSGARLAVISSYALTGIVSFFVPQTYLIPVILLVWAIATIPQTMLNITFSVVMNAVAGPDGRYELMTRRWSILGMTTAITIFLIGQFLDRVPFPLNYQLMFIGLSIGGLISYYFSSHIDLADLTPPPEESHTSLTEKVKGFIKPIRNEKPFISFTIKRFIFLFGFAMSTPLLPIYFVRVVHAPDSWIASINTARAFIMIFGYFIWSTQSRKHGSRRVLIFTTFGVALYPIIIALTSQVYPIPLYAALYGIFQAGVDLVFFDELMRTIPIEYSATFVAIAQSMGHLSNIVSPIVGSWIADNFSISLGLIISGAIQLLGFILFASKKIPFKPSFIKKPALKAPS